MHTFNAPLINAAPYATLGIHLLLVVSILYLRSSILRYANKNLPYYFFDFKLHEEYQHDRVSLAFYNCIATNAFTRTNDAVFIAMCLRFIRWRQTFILFFYIATSEPGINGYL